MADPMLRIGHRLLMRAGMVAARLSEREGLGYWVHACR
jgi:hypothetical protein